MEREHDGHRARMRERLNTEGLNGFAPHEVLEILLFYAIPQRNVNPIAHRLMERFGSLREVLNAPVSELCKVDGIGEYAANLLRLSGQLHERLAGEERRALAVLNSSDAAGEYCVRLLCEQKEECFYLLSLSAKLEVLREQLLAKGAPGAVAVSPRQAVEAVLQSGARFAIAVHNHPGGSTEPSPEDIAATQKLRGALSAVGVPLLDHFIVCGRQSVSMAALGLIAQEETE